MDHDQNGSVTELAFSEPQQWSPSWRITETNAHVEGVCDVGFSARLDLANVEDWMHQITIDIPNWRQVNPSAVQVCFPSQVHH